MPILQSEIKFYESTNGLGGAITANEITDNELHNVFDVVSSDEALLGDTNYRCIYVKNTNGSITLENTIAYLVSNTASITTDLELGLGSGAVGSSEQAIPDETTAPATITFTSLLGEGNSLAIGNLPAGSWMALWLKRVVDASTLAASADGVTISVDGDTGA